MMNLLTDLDITALLHKMDAQVISKFAIPTPILDPGIAVCEGIPRGSWNSVLPSLTRLDKTW